MKRVPSCLAEDQLALGVLVEELAGKLGDLLDLLLQEVLLGPVGEAVAVAFAAKKKAGLAK